MEWKDEVTKDVTGDGGHRHTNHLFWLHPGSQIVIGRSEQDDKYADAMKVTLNTRGDEGTGWSKAINKYLLVSDYQINIYLSMEKKVGENVKLNLTKVKLAMATKCLSSRGLAEKTKIPYPTLVPYLRGAREPKPETTY